MDCNVDLEGGKYSVHLNFNLLGVLASVIVFLSNMPFLARFSSYKTCGKLCKFWFTHKITFHRRGETLSNATLGNNQNFEIPHKNQPREKLKGKNMFSGWVNANKVMHILKKNMYILHYF